MGIAYLKPRYSTTEDDTFAEIEAKARPIGFSLPFIIVLLLAIFAECWLWLKLIDGSYTGGTIFILHAGISLIVAAFAFLMHKAGGDARLPWLLAMVLAMMGVFGVFGAALVAVLNIVYKRSATTFREWFTTMFPEEDMTLSSVVKEEIRETPENAMSTGGLLPFRDIIALGNETQKRQAITKMARHFNPRFASALLAAAQDSSNNIRVQAASAITKIEHAFVERSMRLEELIEKNPDDSSLLAELAHHYDAYAFAGILDPDREKESRERAMETYRRYLRLEPRDVNATLDAGRLLLRSGKAKEAADWFAQAIDRGVVSPAIYLWYMESLFSLKRFSEIRQLASLHFHELAPLSERESRVAPMLQLWAQQGDVGGQHA